MSNINNKLDTKFTYLMEFVKPTDLKVLSENFMLLRDSEGWTNGFMADLIGLENPKLQAVATINEKKLNRFVIEKEQCPSIKQLLNFTPLHLVIDIELDLNNGFLKLITDSEFTCHINPIYLVYFLKNYSSLGDISFEVQENRHKSVVVRGSNYDGVVGLIMPVWLA